MEGPKGKHIFGLVRVGERGQIVIPKQARAVFGIHAGDELMLVGDEQSGLAIITSDHLNKLFGDILQKEGADDGSD